MHRRQIGQREQLELVDELVDALEVDRGVAAFGGDGRGYFTASEGEHPTLHFFAPRHPCR